jgi:hypothetical protein
MKLHDVKMPLSGYRLQARSANTEEAESARNQAIHLDFEAIQLRPVWTPFGTLMAGSGSGRDIDDGRGPKAG